MSQSELDRRPDARRIRHDARDGLAAAAPSLAASVLVVVVLGLAVRWLG